ncbi:MAG TPA: DNA repair exonuclease [Capsulimonadaceae bacterium]|jgi:hypothetical protein
MTTKILCIGDIHIGRIPGHIPQSLEQYALAPSVLGPVTAWQRSVDEAISQRVDAVVLSGDLVDDDKAFYAALGPLEFGLERLGAENIPVYAVAGNHDGDVLPRLASHLGRLRILGPGGTWTAADLPGGVRIAGWSFTGTSVTSSPMPACAAALAALPAAAGPTIGLLHCDLGAVGGTYAPVAHAELADPAVSAWLLGHIHQPGRLGSQARPVGYLGTLSPLDPTESGVRGPWMLTVDGGSLTMQHLPLAPLRWETFDLTVDDLDQLVDFEGFISEAVRARTEALTPTFGDARAVGYRINLTGATRHHRDLPKKCADAAGQLVRKIGAVVCFVDKVSCTETRPVIDLAACSNGTDPPAVLARMLLDIQQRTETGNALIARAIPRLSAELRQDRWVHMDPLTLDQDYAAAMLLRAGFRALDELLAQRENAGEVSL